MPFTTNLSGTAQVDDSVVALMDQQFLIATSEQEVMEQFVTLKREIGAKSIDIPKYSQLALATTPLTETEDVPSTAIADTKITLTPAEYGAVVTTTLLANLQTGGKADVAAAKLTGIQMGRTMDVLALMALDAGTNKTYASGSNAGATTASHVVSSAHLDKIYSKLSKAGVVKINGSYIAVMHEDAFYDLRQDSSWIEASKYGAPGTLLTNEMGMCKGFRIVVDSNSPIGVDQGASGVNTYNIHCFGANALGKAVSQDAAPIITGPFDKLGRFVNVGWKAVLKYGIVDQDALQTLVVGSSQGANSAGS